MKSIAEMTMKDFANCLTGIEYPCCIPSDLTNIAKERGWVIVYGASDDLIEFDGAIVDEAGVYDGGEVKFDKEGFLPSFEDVEHNPKDCQKWLKRASNTTTIEALWCKEERYSWTYKIDRPHETFEVMEDDEHYCRGIVFAI